MIIRCDKCQTKFSINDEQVGPLGVKVRCAKCQHVFAVSRPEPVASVDAAEVFGETNLFENAKSSVSRSYQVPPKSPTPTADLPFFADESANAVANSWTDNATKQMELRVALSGIAMAKANDQDNWKASRDTEKDRGELGSLQFKNWRQVVKNPQVWWVYGGTLGLFLLALGAGMVLPDVSNELRTKTGELPLTLFDPEKRVGQIQLVDVRSMLYPTKFNPVLLVTGHAIHQGTIPTKHVQVVVQLRDKLDRLVMSQSSPVNLPLDLPVVAHFTDQDTWMAWKNIQGQSLHDPMPGDRMNFGVVLFDPPFPIADYSQHVYLEQIEPNSP